MQPFEQLEARWGRQAGYEAPQVVGCSSGTAALHLALEALRSSPQSFLSTYDGEPQGEILIPDYTMVACARAVVMAGYKPVFVDCDRDNLLLDMEKLEDAISEDTVGIMAVHVYGRVCDMTTIHELAGKYDLYVIEDLAEAHCTTPHPQTHAACWSFYKNKVMFGEEGGMVAFRKTTHAHIARQLRSLGFTNAHDYTHTPRGHNYRLSNLHAQEILTNLPLMQKFVEQRWEQIEIWESNCPVEWVQPMSPQCNVRQTPWVYDIRIPGLKIPQQRRIINALHQMNIQARYGFRPMMTQPEFRRRCFPFSSSRADTRSMVGNLCMELSLPTEACRAAREVIYLPLGQSLPHGEHGGALLTEELARKVFDTIQEVLAA